MKAVAIDELTDSVGSIKDVERWDAGNTVVRQNRASLRVPLLSTAVATAVVVVLTSVAVAATSSPIITSALPHNVAETDAVSLLGEVTPFEEDDIVDPAYWARVRQRIAQAHERLPDEVECEDPEPII